MKKINVTAPVVTPSAVVNTFVITGEQREAETARVKTERDAFVAEGNAAYDEFWASEEGQIIATENTKIFAANKAKMVRRQKEQRLDTLRKKGTNRFTSAERSEFLRLKADLRDEKKS